MMAIRLDAETDESLHADSSDRAPASRPIAHDVAQDDLVPKELAVDPRQALMELIVVSRRLTVAPTIDTMHQKEGMRLRIEQLSAELDAIRFSAFWRLTAPLRRMLTRLPRLRQTLRRAARATRRFLYPSTPMAPVPLPEPSPDIVSLQADGNDLGTEPLRDPLRDFSIAVPLSWARPAESGRRRIAAIVHLYYEELAHEFRSYLACIGEGVDVYVSTGSEFHASLIRRAFEGWRGGTVQVRVVENRGRDIAPKLIAFRDVYANHEYVLHLHGKKSHHATALAPWRQFMLQSLIGGREVVDSILSMMDESPSLGIVGVQHFEPMRHWLGWGGNFERCQELAERMGFELDRSTVLDFPAGSMFWARTAALAPLLALNLDLEEFDKEDGQKDATLAHAIERLYYFACEHAGYRWVKVARPAFYAHTPCIESIPMPGALGDWIEQKSLRLLASNGERPRHEALEPVARPTAEFIREIQQFAMGMRAERQSERRVAVGIVIYENSSAVIDKAVDAALMALARSRSASPGELYVINNGPSPLPLSKQQASVRCLESLGNIGFGAAHNRLMATAFADGATHYVAVNPDGLLHPDAIVAMIDMIEFHHDRVLVEALQFPREHPKVYDVFNFETSWVSGGCLAMSRLAFELLGGFDDRFFMYCEDVDLSWRARAAGLSLKSCPRALFLHEVTNRERRISTLKMIFGSSLRLARQWGAPPPFEEWVIEQMKSIGMDIPSERPEPVPVPWKQYADFRHHLVFSPSRWKSDD